MTIEDFRLTLESAVPNAVVSIDRLPSGTTFVDVRLDDRLVVLESSSRGGFGVSDVSDDSLAFAEHDRAFQTLEEAAEYVFSLLNIPREARSSRTAV